MARSLSDPRVRRRGHNEGSIYKDEAKGRWYAAVSFGYGSDGTTWRRMKVSGRTRAEVVTKLKALQAEHDLGAEPVAGYTVRQAIDDWLADGLEGRSVRTVQLNRDVAKPLVKALGNLELRKLTAQHVRRALNAMARDHSSRTVVLAHNALTRAIRYAEANRQIVHNVAALVDTPKGGQGRPSKALTAEQAAALLAAAQSARLGAYVVLCLMTGIRTEEARALRWENVDLDAGSIAVWRSVRLGGDTKTEKSRRTLGLPEAAVKALREHRKLQAEDRLFAGEIWQDCGLVFTTRLGTQMDAGNVRKQFKAICKAAGLGESWTPRELRTSFVSLMSWSGVPVEEIARLAGHSSSRTTEVIYRREIRPVLVRELCGRQCACTLDQVLSAQGGQPGARGNARPAEPEPQHAVKGQSFLDADCYLDSQARDIGVSRSDDLHRPEPGWLVFRQQHHRSPLVEGGPPDLASSHRPSVHERAAAASRWPPLNTEARLSWAHGPASPPVIDEVFADHYLDVVKATCRRIAGGPEPSIHAPQAGT
jgi:integrase